MEADGFTANVLIVGAAADALNIPQTTLDGLAGDRGHVTRTVLRSEALRLVRDEPIDLLLAASPVSLLASPEFLAAFAARDRPMAVLLLARLLDLPAFDRLRDVVMAEHVPLPIGLEPLRRRVQGVRARGRAAPCPPLLRPTHHHPTLETTPAT